MFVALHHGFDRPGQMLTSGGLGTMGYALPAAMGVKVAQPGRPPPPQSAAHEAKQRTYTYNRASDDQKCVEQPRGRRGA